MPAFPLPLTQMGHDCCRVVSRQNGWELLRERLKNLTKPDGPRLFVFKTCRQFIRTVPVLPGDEIDMDDVDSKAEDHVGDETR
jgi:hypothetical protein